MTSKRGKFLDIESIGNTIDEVTARARAQSVRIALAGGAAMQLWGSDRFTKDVDFFASAPVLGFELVGPLSFGGTQVKTETGVPVDFIVRDDDYAELYEAALYHALFHPPLPVLVVSADYMVGVKLAAGRDKDLLDLRFLLTECEDVDYEAARAIVQSHLGVYAARELDGYLDEYEWLAEREKRPARTTTRPTRRKR